MSYKEHRKSSKHEVVAYSDSDEYSNKELKSKKSLEKKHRKTEEYEDANQVKNKKKSKYDSPEKQLDSDEYHKKKHSKSKKKDRKNEDFTTKKSSEEEQQYHRHPRKEKYSSHKSRPDRNEPERLSDEDHMEKSRNSRNRYEKSRYEDRNRKGDEFFSSESSPEYKKKKSLKHQPSVQKENKGYKERNKNYSQDIDIDRQRNYYNQRSSENGDDFNEFRRREKSRIEKDEPDYKERKQKRVEPEEEKSKDEGEQNESNEPLSKRQKIGNINMRTGGAYIPPARLRMMQDQIKDKGSEEYQRIAWEALKKSIIGMTNKVNGSNISEIVPELFRENIIRGRGVLTRAIMQAQAASPTFTRVYAALVAIINTKFPEIGELLLKRLIVQYKRGFRRNDKTICMSAVRFLAHLLNQEVAHEVLVLEIVTHLLESPSEDSVEVAIACLKECGKKLSQLTPRGMRAITQRVRDVLHEGAMDVRVRYMIEVFFAIQKDGFKDFDIIPPELDLVEEDDKYTHLINLDDAVDAQEMLNIFKFDPDYLENEEKYKSVVKEILGDESEDEGSGNESGSDGEEDDEEKNEENQQIIDMTETNLVCLRRKIYLTIQSSLDFEECAHKLLRLELKPGQVLEMCYMILDCCAQQRTYEKFYGLLAQRFCQLSKIYVEPFTEIFENSYKTIHRLETNKLRNVAKFFAHLLYTDAILWMVLKIIKLNEEDTTSSSRIFIKILFQELCEYMGLPKLNERVKDITLQEAFDGLFPRDHPHNTRFAINFFTSIGLGGLTDELREHLKNLPKNPVVPSQNEDKSSVEEDSSSSSSSSSSSTSSSTSSDSESEERAGKKQTKRKRKK